jgi:hypothetical protein
MSDWRRTKLLQFTSSDQTSQATFHEYEKEMFDGRTVRINITDYGDRKAAWIHLDSSDMDWTRSNPKHIRLYHEEKRGKFAPMLRRLKAVAEKILVQPERLQNTKTLSSANWEWKLTGSEVTEFGVEETWVVRWKNSALNYFKDVMLQIEWTRNTLYNFHYASIDILRTKGDQLENVTFFELVLPVSNTKKQQQLIEQQTEEKLLSPMERLAMILGKAD